jgi:hypothetical protein
MSRNFWLTLAAILVLLPMFQPYDDTDDPYIGPMTRTLGYGGRSGLGLYTDHKTGCQYVKAGFFGGTTPRLDENGKQICRVRGRHA